MPLRFGNPSEMQRAVKDGSKNVPKETTWPLPIRPPLRRQEAFRGRSEVFPKIDEDVSKEDPEHHKQEEKGYDGTKPAGG